MSQHCGRDEHSRYVKARVKETNYSRLRKDIGRNKKVVMEFQDRQIARPSPVLCSSNSQQRHDDERAGSDEQQTT